MRTAADLPKCSLAEIRGYAPTMGAADWPTAAAAIQFAAGDSLADDSVARAPGLAAASGAQAALRWGEPGVAKLAAAVAVLQLAAGVVVLRWAAGVVVSRLAAEVVAWRLAAEVVASHLAAAVGALRLAAATKLAARPRSSGSGRSPMPGPRSSWQIPSSERRITGVLASWFALPPSAVYPT
jgi:hypothetical protein